MDFFFLIFSTVQGSSAGIFQTGFLRIPQDYSAGLKEEEEEEEGRRRRGRKRGGETNERKLCGCSQFGR